MKGLGRTLMINLVVLVVLAGAAYIGYSYWYQGYTYVTTSNAQVSAPIATLSAPGTGVLTNWTVYLGERVSKGQLLGDVAVTSHATGTATSGSISVSTLNQIPVKATSAGVIGQVDIPNGSAVEVGLPLASLVQTSQLYLIANVAETSIASVHIGQKATITVSAYPNQTFTGYVSEIGPATAGSFSLLPTQNTTTDFTPVTQVIPVLIRLDSTFGDVLRAGESATVQISIH
jgi:multidrug resistance efflux pump